MIEIEGSNNSDKIAATAAVKIIHFQKMLPLV